MTEISSTGGWAVRKWVSHVEEIEHDGARPAERPLIKAAVAVVVKNPAAGGYVEDLSFLSDRSGWLASELGRRAVGLLGGAPPASYGKGGLVGLSGEQEHAVACLTTTFGDALREAVGGGEAWIPSTTKTAAAGASLDIPLAHKDALYVRSHYDTVTIAVPDAPGSDELMIAVAVASGPRVHERVGGLSAADIKGGGLR